MAETAIYPDDKVMLDGMSPTWKAAFLEFMDELDAEHAKRGRPYGEGSFWKLTGAKAWRGFFDDGYSAGDALAEDLTYAYE